MKFTDVIYYKQRYKNLYLAEKFVNQDINIITESKNIPKNDKSCCCFLSNKEQDKFFTEARIQKKPFKDLSINTINEISIV